MKDNIHKIIFHENVYDPMFEGYGKFAILRDENNKPVDYQFLEINNEFEKVTGLNRTNVIGRTLKEVFKVSNSNWADINKKLSEVEKSSQFEYFSEKSGRYFQISAFCPSPEIIVTLFMETTVQKRAEQALKIHKILFEGAQDIILYINLDGQIVDSNQRACEIYGYAKEQLLTKKIQDIRHSSTLSDYEEQMQQALTGGIVFECFHVRSDGSTFPVEVSARVVHTEEGSLRIHIIRDITERKEQQSKIAWLAQYDVLTGIQNRASLMMQIENEIQNALQNGTQFAVMLFDIDKFKQFNDNYGHAAGDAVLRYTAEKVKSVLRSSDQIGRLGGDEFVILQKDVRGIEDVKRLVDRIYMALQEPVIHNEIQFHINISIGICLFPTDAKDTDSLILCADKAMYISKRSGGSSYSFFSDKDKDTFKDTM